MGFTGRGQIVTGNGRKIADSVADPTLYFDQAIVRTHTRPDGTGRSLVSTRRHYRDVHKTWRREQLLPPLLVLRPLKSLPPYRLRHFETWPGVYSTRRLPLPTSPVAYSDFPLLFASLCLGHGTYLPRHIRTGNEESAPRWWQLLQQFLSESYLTHEDRRHSTTQPSATSEVLQFDSGSSPDATPDPQLTDFSLRRSRRDGSG